LALAFLVPDSCKKAFNLLESCCGAMGLDASRTMRRYAFFLR
jgi:hypothetical protein